MHAALTGNDALEMVTELGGSERCCGEFVFSCFFPCVANDFKTMSLTALFTSQYNLYSFHALSQYRNIGFLLNIKHKINIRL